MFKLGDKVRYIIDDDVLTGTITDIKANGKYIVTATVDEDWMDEMWTNRDEVAEKDLELLPIIKISKEYLIRIIRYEVNLDQLIHGEPAFEYEFESSYEPDMNDMITCLSNISKELEESDHNYNHWHAEMFLGDLGDGYDIHSLVECWNDFKDNARLEKINDYTIIGLTLSKMDNWDFYEMVPDEKKKIIEEILKDLENYQKNKVNSVAERYYPSDIKKAFIDYYYIKDFKDDVSDDELVLFRKFVHELTNNGDLRAKEILGYSYYTGNKAIQNDWIKSRDIFIELYNETGSPAYANTLGYIFYYGRCTNGTPEYEKAYRYFSIGALNGYYESSYKVADMFAHGYGVPVNKDTALRLYNNVYVQNLELIEEEKFSSKFADAALRMGGAMENKFDECDPVRDAYYYYLQADFAIRKRLQFDLYGDQVVYNGVQKSLNRIKGQFEKNDIDKKSQKFGIGALGLIGSHKYPVQVKIKFLRNSIKFTTSRIFKRNDVPSKCLLTIPDCSYCDLVDKIVFRCNEAIDIEIMDDTNEFIFNEVEYDFGAVKYYYDGKLTAILEEAEITWKCPTKKNNKSIKYRFASIRFTNNGREYDYLCDDESVQVGDHVIVDGYNGETEVEVTGVFFRDDDETGLPLNKYKKIKRKV